MLTRAHRMRRAEDFRDTLRRGSRAGSGTVVVHVHPTAADPGPPQIGFIVNKSVGSAVVRNRAQRRLRHLVASYVDDLPRGTRVVVRALPASAGASGVELAGDLDACLRRALSRAEQVTPA